MNDSNRRERILVVDDSPRTLGVVQRLLSASGYAVLVAPGPIEARGILESTPSIDLVITDLRMPGGSGLELVQYVRENMRNTEVMMITGYASIEGAVQAMHAGAEEYLSKPFTDRELLEAVRRALDKLCTRLAAYALWSRPQQNPTGIISESPAMQKVFQMILKASSTSATVLISGESGTGKELVARAIHYGSARASSAFVTVNCGAIPEGLLESELFGHVKGSFTGATSTRAGFFQTAQNGTILLDEISEMTPSMQVKLLRVLQSREVFMVGSSHPRLVDVRVIAASNQDLRAAIQKRTFRDDLFYRINVIPIDLPPLRKRDNDVEVLARWFSNRFAELHDRQPLEFTDAALASLRSYTWPGNVRELENLVQRLVIVVDNSTVDVTDLPGYILPPEIRRRDITKRSLAEVEAEYVQNVLDSVGGNKSRAAAILGISRKTLRDKLHNFLPDVPSTSN